MKRIAAVVVTYNGEHWIRKCLSSLRSSGHTVETIVVDNGSGDRTCEIIKSEFPECELIESGSNLGFGAGNNLGIVRKLTSEPDYIFLLNQDAWIDEATLDLLVAQAEAHPEYGVVSPIHFNGDGSLLDKRFLQHLSLDNRALYTDLFNTEASGIYEVNFVNAACWLLPRDCIDKVGLFDPAFLHYGEDENFADRMQYFGKKIGIVSEAKAWHDREDRIAAASKRKRFKKNGLKTRWLRLMCDPANHESAFTYWIKLLLFLVRCRSAGKIGFGELFPSFFRLSALRSEVVAARERMRSGMDGYAAIRRQISESSQPVRARMDR